VLNVGQQLTRICEGAHIFPLEHLDPDEPINGTAGNTQAATHGSKPVVNLPWLLGPYRVARHPMGAGINPRGNMNSGPY